METTKGLLGILFLVFCGCSHSHVSTAGDPNGASPPIACAQSEACKQEGKCTRQFGACGATSRDDCARSLACKWLGKCTLYTDLQCAAISNRACRESDICEFQGLCRARNGECVAPTVKVRRTTILKHITISERIGNQCRYAAVGDGLLDALRGAEPPKNPRPPKLDKSRLSRHCARHGRCSTNNGKCVADTHADCAVSQDCKRLGKCTAVGGRCVVGSGAGCPQSVKCRVVGGCTARDGVCSAVSGRDCKQAKLCVLAGYCTAKDGRCVRP